MIDQFIYTRADGTKRSNANGQSFGFGLTHFTDGIPAIRTEVSDASYYVNRLTDCDGQRIRILRKQTLADGLFCIQQSLIHDTTKETGRDTFSLRASCPRSPRIPTPGSPSPSSNTM